MSAQNTRYVAPGQSSAGLGSYTTKNLNAYMKPPPRTSKYNILKISFNFKIVVNSKFFRYR